MSMATTAVSSMKRPQLERGPVLGSIFDLEVADFGFEPLRVEGKLPLDLAGTLYRNGPTTFGKLPAPHVFDGNGAITAVRIARGRAEGAVSGLHAPSADVDARRARPRYASWGQPMSILQMLKAFTGVSLGRNTANINVLAWQGRLFAMTEGSPPLEVDPQTLATLGETDLDGVSLGAWNAHPHYVPSRKTTYQFGVRFGRALARNAHLDVYALPDAGEAKLLTSIALGEPIEVHDFFVTDRHLVFVLVPLAASWNALLRERGAYGKALSWRPERGVEVVVIPIDRPSEPTRIQDEAFFFWHSSNAFEESDGRIILDFIRYPEWTTQGAWIEDSTNGRDGARQTGKHWRGALDLGARRATWEPRGDAIVEFPTIHPDWRGRAERYVWSSGYSPATEGRGLANRLVRHDLTRGTSLYLDPGVHGPVGEPTLVPKHGASGETDVWTMALVGDVDSMQSQLAIWDGARPEDGPVARLHFQKPIGVSFHGTWIPAATT